MINLDSTLPYLDESFIHTVFASLPLTTIDNRSSVTSPTAALGNLANWVRPRINSFVDLYIYRQPAEVKPPLPPKSHHQRHNHNNTKEQQHRAQRSEHQQQGSSSSVRTNILFCILTFLEIITMKRTLQF